LLLGSNRVQFASSEGDSGSGQSEHELNVKLERTLLIVAVAVRLHQGAVGLIRGHLKYDRLRGLAVMPARPQIKNCKCRVKFENAFLRKYSDDF
jgi:hypothetical protein